MSKSGSRNSDAALRPTWVVKCAPNTVVDTGTRNLDELEFQANIKSEESEFLSIEAVIDEYVIEDYTMDSNLTSGHNYDENTLNVNGIEIKQERYENLNMQFKEEPGLDIEDILENSEQAIKKMAKYLCKLWNADRSKKKAFMCPASIDLILKKAKDYSLFGNKLVLECDGTEIDDDETLQAFLEDKSTLIILNSKEIWKSTNISATTGKTVQQTSTERVNTNADEAHSFSHTQSSVDACDELFSNSEVESSSCEDSEDENELLCNAGNPKKFTSSGNSAWFNKNIQAACDLFHDYQIPWAKMSPQINKAVKEKKQLGKLLNAFCNVVVDDLRQTSHYIPMNVYRGISQMAANKYPDTFIERDGQKNIMSHTPVSVMTTLRNRNNFLNSSSKRRKISSIVPNKKRKPMNVPSRTHVNRPTKNIEDRTSKKHSSTLAQSSIEAGENFSQNGLLQSQSSPTEHISNSAVSSTSCQDIKVENADSQDENTFSGSSTWSNKNFQAACDLFNDYEIPWAKMSPEITRAVEKKKQLGKLLNAFCNVVVDDLRQISLYIPMSVYRSVSLMAANKYPDTFVEKDGHRGNISQPPVSVITTMRNRNNFLNSSSRKQKINSIIPNKQKKTQNYTENNEDLMLKEYSFSITQSSIVDSQNDLILSESSPTEHISNSCQDFEEENEFIFITDNPDENTSSASSICSNKTPQIACDLFYEYEIPWAKMSPEINRALKEKKQLGRLLNTFCNVVVDDLRQMSLFIPVNVYRKISQMAANKYPDSFIERDDQGNVVSHTPVSVLKTMRNRNNFLNSATKRQSTTSAVPRKKRKCISLLSRTCVNWQAENIEEKSEDITFKKQFLISMHQKNTLQECEKDIVKEFMADCFSAQRIFFNDTESIPTVEDILHNWPMIFYKECLFEHFQKLMELDVRNFITNFRASENKLKSFFKIQQNGNADSIVKAICKYFKENETLLFKKFTFGTTVEDVKRDNKTLTPWASIIYTSPSKKESVSYIWLQGEIIAKEENLEIADLILQLLCYYYIFNIEYPKDISQSFEFFMRYFLKFYPSKVRGKKKNLNNLGKINSLIVKIDQIF